MINLMLIKDGIIVPSDSGQLVLLLMLRQCLNINNMRICVGTLQEENNCFSIEVGVTAVWSVGVTTACTICLQLN